MRSRILAVVFGAATMLLAAGAVSAQEGVPPDPVPGPGTGEPVGEPMTEPVPAPADTRPVIRDTVVSEPGYTVRERVVEERAVVRRPMASVQLGGGVTNFVGEGARGRTNVGGSWELRLGFAPWQMFGIEAAYVGSAHDVNQSGFDDGAYLLGNGAEANLRLNVPLTVGRVTLAPFAFGGLGWTRYDLMDTENRPEEIETADDHILTLPLGAGLAMSINRFYLDARFTYRPAFDAELFGDQNLDTWGVAAHVGSVF